MAPLVPDSAYLAGGTGLTVHLHHRVSRDLDFMLEHDEDLERLREALEEAGRLGVTYQDAGTLHGMLDGTKVQFLRAAGAIRAEEGISLFLDKYRPRESDQTVTAVVQPMAYLDDVADDPALPVGRDVIQDYWTTRQREIIENLSRG